ncbi:MAG: hypothetical protein EZS28_010596 [Streblomastix strix]|uniref:Uncharacterized protein n=1 Tax=Streblomastix strix TaxID=222440 RepID=A0A5J4WFR1_9EUKA|nr:MAG: hypothetical protein EZS28_010596 [Streblomastix strix]
MTLAQTYCASILAVLGMLPIILDRAREAKRQGKEYGGSFMIFGEAETEQEDKEIKKIIDIKQEQQIGTNVIKRELKSLYTSTLITISSKEVGGIAILANNEDIPKFVNLNWILSTKGIVLEISQNIVYETTPPERVIDGHTENVLWNAQ